jgi:hypothetical protein
MIECSSYGGEVEEVSMSRGLRRKNRLARGMLGKFVTLRFEGCCFAKNNACSSTVMSVLLAL